MDTNNIYDLLALTKSASGAAVFAVLLRFQEEAGSNSLIMSEEEIEAEAFTGGDIGFELDQLFKNGLINYRSAHRPKLKQVELVIDIKDDSTKTKPVETIKIEPPDSEEPDMTLISEDDKNEEEDVAEEKATPPWKKFSKEK